MTADVPGVRDIDQGWGLLARMFNSKPDITIELGVIDEGTDRDALDEPGAPELTNAFLLSVHEYGAPKMGVPARAPIRTTVDDELEGWSTTMRRIIQAGIKARDWGLVRRLFDGLGEKMSSAVRKKIASGLEPELTDETLAAKRRTRLDGKDASTPLVLTGQLQGAITHRVVEK